MLNNNLDIENMEDDELFEKEQNLWESISKFLPTDKEKQLLLDYANVTHEMTLRQEGV